jgi:hypothetical protein
MFLTPTCLGVFSNKSPTTCPFNSNVPGSIPDTERIRKQYNNQTQSVFRLLDQKFLFCGVLGLREEAHERFQRIYIFLDNIYEGLHVYFLVWGRPPKECRSLCVCAWVGKRKD